MLNNIFYTVYKTKKEEVVYIFLMNIYTTSSFLI